jgi:hypothetical protein
LGVVDHARREVLGENALKNLASFSSTKEVLRKNCRSDVDIGWYNVAEAQEEAQKCSNKGDAEW